MILEIYLFRFILFCLGAFIFGYFIVYQTLVNGNHDKGFDTFYVFNKIKLPNLFEAVWKGVVNILKIITGGKIEIEKFDTKK